MERVTELVFLLKMKYSLTHTHTHTLLNQQNFLGLDVLSSVKKSVEGGGSKFKKHFYFPNLSQN